MSNNLKAQQRESFNGRLKLPELPSEIRQVIEDYYADPIKLDLNQQPHDIRLSSLTKGEAMTLAQLVCMFAPQRSLEIGLAAASSCVAIATAHRHLGLNAKHVTLDPYQQTLSGSAGLSEISKAGLDDYVSWIPERSENYLSAAVAQGEKYDFIFIDSAHDIGQTVTDAFYVHRTLSPQGVVAFHDSCLFSTAAAVRYLALECNYSLIQLPPDSSVKRFGRSLRYLNSLGTWYSTRVVPKMHRSLVALKRND